MATKIAVVALIALLVRALWVPVPTGGLSAASEDQLLPADVRSAAITDEPLPADVRSA